MFVAVVRKLHTQTLLISKSHIQNPLKVSEDKATTTCLVVNNVPALFNSVCFVEDIMQLDIESNAFVYG
jgi:hypothetical protein